MKVHSRMGGLSYRYLWCIMRLNIEFSTSGASNQDNFL